MTDEEHEARAMLLGLRYHHGNGSPFYYQFADDGTPDTMSLIDANTLEPLAERVPGSRYGGIVVKNGKGKMAHAIMWDDFGQNRLPSKRHKLLKR